ncbi:unnamed protein product [Adineta steineri]|uniref:Uncharacterized protein n=1 Tax=Adineta steineri TaxID=433720 RepID=A0A815Y7B5_9BILA|nr:unnamed protein product [Adineta steineri]CAF1667255.1 unnamed protein product [Adineta steineri]
MCKAYSINNDFDEDNSLDTSDEFIKRVLQAYEEKRGTKKTGKKTPASCVNPLTCGGTTGLKCVCPNTYCRDGGRTGRYCASSYW